MEALDVVMAALLKSVAPEVAEPLPPPPKLLPKLGPSGAPALKPGADAAPNASIDTDEASPACCPPARPMLPPPCPPAKPMLSPPISACPIAWGVIAMPGWLMYGLEESLPANTPEPCGAT
jgi:hypothetical protein